MGIAELPEQPIVASTLARAVREARVASAYLFEGADDAPQQHAAIALAQALNCLTAPGNGCGECSICMRIAKREHPDVRFFQPRDKGNRNIPVEQIREELLPFTRFAPFEGRHALVVFEQAELCFPRAQAESANALLKTLEEPRANLHFVLLTARPKMLPTTIRSRCQRVVFRHHGGVSQIVDEALLDESKRLDVALDHASLGERIELAEKLTKREDLAALLHAWSLVCRDTALGAEHNQMIERHQVLGAERAAFRARELLKTLTQLETHANKQLTLDTLLARMQAGHN